MQIARAALLLALLWGAAAFPETETCAESGCDDAEEAGLLQHRRTVDVGRLTSKTSKFGAAQGWNVARLLCDGEGEDSVVFPAGECQQAVSNPLYSVMYTCVDETSSITEHFYMNTHCSGQPQTQVVQPGVCLDTALGMRFKYSCQRSVPGPGEGCFTADFKQYNMQGVQSHGVKGEFNGHGLIFSWLNGGMRKMVLTDLHGKMLKAGFVPDRSMSYKDTDTWNDRPFSKGYTITNFQQHCGDLAKGDYCPMTSRCKRGLVCAAGPSHNVCQEHDPNGKQAGESCNENYECDYGLRCVSGSCRQ